jgi:hypothetical protein
VHAQTINEFKSAESERVLAEIATKLAGELQ